MSEMIAIFLAPSVLAAHSARGLFSVTSVGVTRVISGRFCSVIFGLMAPQTIIGIWKRWKTGMVASATELFQWPVAATTSGSLTSFMAAETPVCGSAASSRTTPSTL